MKKKSFQPVGGEGVVRQSYLHSPPFDSWLSATEPDFVSHSQATTRTIVNTRAPLTAFWHVVPTLRFAAAVTRNVI
jgi:hypothetical protein